MHEKCRQSAGDRPSRPGRGPKLTTFAAVSLEATQADAGIVGAGGRGAEGAVPARVGTAGVQDCPGGGREPGGEGGESKN